MSISIVIITHNKINYLKLVLENLKRNNIFSEQEVLIVNDGSLDGTSEYLEEFKQYNSIRHINIQPSGSAFARNKGIEMTSGDYILFMDDDILIMPDFILNLKQSIKEYPDRVHSGKLKMIPLAYVSTIIKDFQEWSNLDLGRIIQHCYTDPIYGALAIAHKNVTDLSTNYDLACSWGLVSGGNICFPRSILNKIGYFDLEFNGWGPEDIDLCYRAFKNNYLFKYNSDCQLYHLDHIRNTEAIRNSLMKNCLLLYKKYNKPREILFYLNFFNGMVSLDQFNKVCVETNKFYTHLPLDEYYINLKYYLQKEQIINWRKDETH